VKLIAWNIKGYDSFQKKVAVRRLMKKEKPTAIGIVETKLDNITQWDV